MAKGRTTYRIEGRTCWMMILVWELHQWGETRYTLDGDAIVTTCKNVVDVATETFANIPNAVTIIPVRDGVTFARMEQDPRWPKDAFGQPVR